MSDGRMAVLGLAVPLSVIAGYWLWDPVVIPEPIGSDTSLVDRENSPSDARQLEIDRAPNLIEGSTQVFTPPVAQRPEPVEVSSSESEPPASDDDGATSVPAVSRPPSSVRTYTVKAGDTLSGISFQEYGSSRYVDLIFNANRDLLPSKNALAVGQSLVLPELPAESE